MDQLGKQMISKLEDISDDLNMKKVMQEMLDSVSEEYPYGIAFRGKAGVTGLIQNGLVEELVQGKCQFKNGLLVQTLRNLKL